MPLIITIPYTFIYWVNKIKTFNLQPGHQKLFSPCYVVVAYGYAIVINWMLHHAK